MSMGIPRTLLFWKTVRAAECDLDEICKPLEECEEEMKLYRSGQRDMLKVCGVKIKTVRNMHVALLFL